MSDATAEGKPSAFTLRSTVRMATWNVLSLAKTRYVEAICQELSKYRVNVAGLTETNLTGAGQAAALDPEYWPSLQVDTMICMQLAVREVRLRIRPRAAACHAPLRRYDVDVTQYPDP